jgi:hypothetical protein
VDAEPKPRIMSLRWRISVALLLGLTTSVALAWLLAIFPVDQWLGVSAPLSVGMVVVRTDAKSRCVVEGNGKSSPFGSDMDVVNYQWAIANEQAPLVSPDSKILKYCDLDALMVAANSPGTKLEVHRVGWPRSAFEWRRQIPYGTFSPSVGAAPGATYFGAIVLPFSSKYGIGSAVLPVIPRWGALAADTAFFGFFWMLLLMLPRLARTVEWWWKRRCSVCGYDRRGLVRGAPCPECGNVSLTLKPR